MLIWHSRDLSASFLEQIDAGELCWLAVSYLVRWVSVFVTVMRQIPRNIQHLAVDSQGPPAILIGARGHTHTDQSLY